MGKTYTEACQNFMTEERFEEHINATRSRLLRYVRRCLSFPFYRDAEDVLQNGLLRAYKNMGLWNLESQHAQRKEKTA
ncbi:MAG: hypothetical protein HY513_00240 [Candidatus Aenigmarchaeota archaeon]|nr:hypothetical protein [Candidatus Aenigmarchaeota archaeon]